jgi:hypothetical protein
LFELKKGSTKEEVKALADAAKNVHASFTNVSNRQSFGPHTETASMFDRTDLGSPTNQFTFNATNNPINVTN